MALRLSYLSGPAHLIAWARRLVEDLNRHFSGHLAAEKVRTLTISGGLTATTVTDRNVTPDSLILVMPTNLEARSKRWYVDPGTIGVDTWQMQHDTISATATFSYVILS